ncbi:MAG TPA: sulfite exporter TauE/SafE family protein, partial [Tepidisphaeraceae bacterium]|nr:sulfite exporter TauE/SafE family protein [Tepidisphaeraceae bacterium]
EIVVAAGSGGTVLQSNVARQSRSKGLIEYPELTTAPPDDREANCVIEVGGGLALAGAATTPHPATQPATATTGRGGTPRDAFTSLISGRDLSLGFIIAALGIAVVMGMFHGFSPGHGKTVVAAYLVGSHGTARHAVLLGAVVTMTHVAAVFALGIAVIVASRWFVAEDVYPWVGFASGLMIVAIGVWQFSRRWALRNNASPPLGHVHGPGGHSHQMPDRITLPGLVALGVSGGIVPCPSALVVLMSAIAFKQTAFGMLLIVAFSIGLAGVLIAIGMTMLFARGVLQRWDNGTGRVAGVISRLALASPVAIALLGTGIAVQALLAGRVW